MWLIDEKAMIFRVDLCDKPPIAPRIADKIIANETILKEVLLGLSKQNKAKTKGAIFCHVSTIPSLNQLNPSII